MQTKWTLLPSDETQNVIQADAGKDETVESIRHFKITHVEGTDYMRVVNSYLFCYIMEAEELGLSSHK